MMGHDNLYASAKWLSQEGEHKVVRKPRQDNSTLNDDRLSHQACMPVLRGTEQVQPPDGRSYALGYNTV